jgi:type II secretory pathway pseudopilin PulG
MQQVVCTKCRCSNQFGTVFCRNCGKKLPDLDMNHPDRKLQNDVKNILKRLVKLIVVLAILTLLGAIVLPVGFKTEKKMSQRELDVATKNYELMEKRIKEGDGFNGFVMPPPEAGYIATQMITPALKEKSTEEETETETETETDAESETPVDPGKITCTIFNDELTIIYTKKYYKVLQCRIEITGKFHQEKIEAETEEEDDKKKKSNRKKEEPETELQYTMTGARLGHIPMPKLLFPHMLELFRTIVFNKKIERAISLVEDVKVDSKSITVSFKQQIK